MYFYDVLLCEFDLSEFVEFCVRENIQHDTASASLEKKFQCPLRTPVALSGQLRPAPEWHRSGLGIYNQETARFRRESPR